MNEDAITNLFYSHAKIIYKYLRKHGCSKEDAEEIVQESFTKVVQYFDSIEVNKLSSWIFQVALNQYRNQIKRKAVLTELTVDEGFFSRFAAEEDLLEIVLTHESVDLVRDCLNSLKLSFRELLVLKYELELSYREIGTLLVLPETTVKTYLYRARNEFKRVWREKNG